MAVSSKARSYLLSDGRYGLVFMHMDTERKYAAKAAHVRRASRERYIYIVTK